LPDDVLGRDYDFEGRVTVELLNRVLRTKEYDYFICGPTPFMNALENGLEQWGVPPQRIHLEAFGGPKPVTQPRRAALAATGNANSRDIGAEIIFLASGRQLIWVPSYDNLLDLAEANGVAIESGCRAGNCGTCAIPVKSGTVIYPSPPDLEPEAGMCLPCVCLPAGPVELDA
jgi:ferredoxin